VNPLVTYSLARLVLFVAALGVVYLLGARQLIALLLAAAISMLLSYVLLRPLRDQAAERLAARAQRRMAPRQPSEDEAVEDAAVEASLDAAEAPRPREGGSTDSTQG